jgi:hypothetical protein
MTNKPLYRITLAIMLFAVAAGMAGAGEWKSAGADDFWLEWMVDGDDLHVVFSSITSGWIAVGFNPTRKMKDANIIMGYVDDGEVTIEDHFGNSQISHRNDEAMGGTNNVIIIDGSEIEGVTELSFTIPLDSGDPHDRALVEGQTYKVIFASHTKDKITMKHNRRTSREITL